MEILSYILADAISRSPRPYNGYVQWNQKPSYLLCFTEKYLYFNTADAAGKTPSGRGTNKFLSVTTMVLVGNLHLPPSIPPLMRRNWDKW
jgi:hypothetical protein